MLRKFQVSVAAVLFVAVVSASVAQAENAAAANHVLPPLSYAIAKYYEAHPQDWARFVASLPARPGQRPEATVNRVRTASARGSWQAVTKDAAGLCNPLLLHDGTVLAHICDSPNWSRLTPDINGDYAHGTWSQIAPMPVINGVQYAPQYNASAVLPDGRVIVMGGEYNGGNNEVWVNLGAIYDPVANAWTPVTAPSGAGWSMIGDAESTVLANGTFMLASCCANPDADALLDASTLTWTATGAPAAGDAYQDEQGYELLPNDHVLTIDMWTNYPNGGATNAEQYKPSVTIWTSAGNTPVSLADPSQCGNWEIGPAVTRGDGTLVAFGGNTGCVKGDRIDPTAIYQVAANSWSPGPNVPKVCGRLSNKPCSLPDAPAAPLPDGSILFAASSGYGDRPTHFFVFTKSNVIYQVSDPLYNSDRSGAFYYNFLVLPSGQIFSTDFSRTAELYTPRGKANADSAPHITSMRKHLEPGYTYGFRGTDLNGISQGAAYGDDVQAETNYPLVRIVNDATGHVFYATTSGYSSMAITPGKAAAAKFTVPTSIETGPSQLYVVANGNPSSPIAVTVR